VKLNINIQEIVDNKIKALNDDGTIKAAIENTIETTMLKAITDALGDYSLRSTIEKQVTKEVSEVVASIGFTAYNSFIAEKVKQITEGVCRVDITEKIQKVFDEMLVMKHENIKLSEIFEKYREWVCGEVEDSEKYSLERFHVKFEEDERYGWFNIELAKEKPKDRHSSYSSDDVIKFTVHRGYKDKGIGTISSTYIDGSNIKEKFRFKHMSDIELLLVNLTYNDTPIIIDIESEDDIDSSYDVDI
jgi:hypothetical protein